jgi:hypothetical protein
MNYDWLNTKKKSELNKLAKLAGLTVYVSLELYEKQMLTIFL